MTNTIRDLLDQVAAQLPALEARVAQTHAIVERHRAAQNGGDDAGSPGAQVEDQLQRRAQG